VDESDLQARLDYRFQDQAIFAQALTHRSYAVERGGADNERLEFLGDAVLELLITELLMRRFPDSPEGALSRLRARMVRTETLGRVAVSLDLGSHLKLGRGEERTGGRAKPSILGDCLEAILGAVFRDGGLDAARGLVTRAWADEVSQIDDPRTYGRDPKSTLQEHTQAIWRLLPQYRVVGTEGPAHARTYQVEVQIGDRARAEGEGTSRRNAERAAASSAMCLLREQEE
jgi:ribonuclease-3